MTDEPDRGDLGGVVHVDGPDRRQHRRGVVHIAPADGVCSVDPLGCGYCLGVPCRQPNPGAARLGRNLT